MTEILDNLIYTDNFGIVLKKDYNNLRFDFLKRDKGVPVIEIDISKWVDGTVVDNFGNRKKGKVEKKEKEVRVAPEYIDYLDLLKRRKKAQFAEYQALQELIK